jgi:uncharacterized membrane protein YdjX (TVP38/TMEM64 family)
VKCCVEGYIQRNKRLRLLLKLIEARPLTFVAICRVSPFLPYTPTNYVFGFGSDVSPASFTLVSVPCIFAGVFMQANTGSALGGVAVRLMLA